MPPNRISSLLGGICGLLASIAPVQTPAQTPPAPAAPTTSPNGAPPQGQPPQTPQASGDPTSSTAGSLFDTKLPALDPSNGLLRFNGQTWDVTNNAIFRSRFEKYLNTPEESGENEREHRETLNRIIALLNPNNLTAFPFKMPGITSGLKPATSKSFIHRSGVING
jgi:hypothetical protein